MSNVAIKGGATGTATYTIEAPTGNTDRTLVLPDEAGTVLTSASLITSAVPAFSAASTNPTSISGGSRAKITFAIENFDTNSNFASSRFTPTVEGYYQINLSFQGDGTSAILQAELYKNGSGAVYGGYIGNPGIYYMASLSTIIYMNGTTDYLEGYCYSNVSINVGYDEQSTFFNGVLVRAV